MLPVGTSERMCGLAQPSPTVVGHRSRSCWELGGELSLDRHIDHFPDVPLFLRSHPIPYRLAGEKDFLCLTQLRKSSLLVRSPTWRSALPQVLHTRISIHTDRRGGGCSSSEGNHWARLSCSRRIIGVWVRVSVNRRSSRLSNTKEY